MKVVTSLADADVSHPSVVSIGNFDGLHLGHRQSSNVRALWARSPPQ